MIRLSWRQFRTQGAIALGVLVIVAVMAALTGPHLVHLYDTTVATCASRGDCSAVTTAFLADDSTLKTWLGILVLVVPGIIGVFWGAPLVARELEAGTHRLAWTQSVTRTRWLVVKLGMVGLAGMATAGALGLLVTWWASPLDRANMNVFGTFDQRGIVPLGYAAFAFVLGAAAGVLIRRSVPAMATTLVLFAAARLEFVQAIRPHLIAPLSRIFHVNVATTGFGSDNGGPFTLLPNPPALPNAWIYSAQIVDRAGRPLSSHFVAVACPRLVASAQRSGGGGGRGRGPSRVPAPAGVEQMLQNCASKVGTSFREVVTYQPASHYWALQWYETAIFLGAAMVLASVCMWRVRRRLT